MQIKQSRHQGDHMYMPESGDDHHNFLTNQLRQYVFCRAKLVFKLEKVSFLVSYKLEIQFLEIEA